MLLWKWGLGSLNFPTSKNGWDSKTFLTFCLHMGKEERGEVGGHESCQELNIKNAVGVRFLITGVILPAIYYIHCIKIAC